MKEEVNVRDGVGLAIDGLNGGTAFPLAVETTDLDDEVKGLLLAGAGGDLEPGQESARGEMSAVDGDFEGIGFGTGDTVGLGEGEDLADLGGVESGGATVVAARQEGDIPEHDAAAAVVEGQEKDIAALGNNDNGLGGAIVEDRRGAGQCEIITMRPMNTISTTISG